MKPQLLQVSKDLIHSFSARHDTTPNINNRWHYHPEVELIYFRKGNGTQYIGDSISPFYAGNIVLVGSNLPHYWKFDGSFFNDTHKESVDVSVVHFNESFWGSTFLNLPENKIIRQTLDDAARGIHITGAEQSSIGNLIEMIVGAEGSRKIILLMEVLSTIGLNRQNSYLASIGFKHNFQESEKDRIHAIYNYSLANFKKKISLDDIAAVANVSPKSFCKYFKSKSRKTYSLFINEIRVGYACKLLIDGNIDIKEACYESGFYNFTSFHKYFKLITGKSPLSYQRSFTKFGKP